MRSKQLSLFETTEMIDLLKVGRRTIHGGEKTKGKRKTKRPVVPKKWHHIVLKCAKTKTPLSLKQGGRGLWIEKLIRAKAKKFHLSVGDFVNAGNHLHLKIKPMIQDGLGKFLKSVTGLIARRFTGACRGRPFGTFWEGLAFSRVLTSAKEELYLRGYFQANLVQIQKSYAAREKFLKDFHAWVQSLRKAKIHLIAPIPTSPDYG
jgi:REP element-mobilizing transposase RayT